MILQIWNWKEEKKNIETGKTATQKAGVENRFVSILNEEEVSS